MRTLTFAPNDLRFDLMYSSLVQSPLALNGSTERKTQIGILEKFEAIGTLILVRDQKTQEDRLPKKNELSLYETLTGGDIELTDPEYDLLKKHATATINADAFPKAYSREGQKIIDGFEAA